MKKSIATPEIKKEITKDWKSLLPDYKLHSTYHFLKRNGPVLLGVYLHRTGFMYDYTPQFHTHLLLEPFGGITLTTLLRFYSARGRVDYFSYRRHQNEFDKIAESFKAQFPEALLQTVSWKDISQLYEKSMPDTIGFMHTSMASHILLLYWCGKLSLVEEKIKEYKENIKTWQDIDKVKFGDEDKWEKALRAQFNMDQLNKNVEDEVVKLKLTKYKDYGLIGD